MDQRSAGGIGGSDTVHTHGGGAWTAHELPAGTRIGGYEIECLAGRGGMGVVYRAHDMQLGRTVALKLIGGDRAGDPDRRAGFVRESLTAASIEHPNVLPLYRAGEDDGRLFIAMRFVEGASLAELIAAAPGGLPPGRAARITARVADALDAAHSRRLVHRDVKPGNILIADPDGEEHVYLSDFGLTTGGDGARADGGWTGTLVYLAPEQIRGEAVDPRTDVYALGCVLYHALTGRPPFAGDEEAVLDAHLNARPPTPSEAVPGLPPALDAVVRRAMAKRPEDRYATAGELGRAALAARYDVALLVDPEDRAAAEPLAAGLEASDVLPLVTVAGEPRAAEGIRASGACAVLVGRGGLGDWARDGLAAARAVADHDRAFRLVLVLLPGAPDPGDPTLAYLSDHPWVDLRAGAADALAATDLVRALRGADVPAGLPAEEGVAPYRGLEAFREEDAALYFGRERDVARVLERLRVSRFVAVVGPSGSGKSSLVQAGVLPALRAEGGATAGRRVLEMVPGARPLAALAAQLARLPGAAAPSPADLGADERTLDVATARALEGRPADERVLLVVDQLEEAFTLCNDEGERAAFLGNLVYAATIPGGRTVVVATMRADFYHRLTEHPALRGLVASQQVLLGPLDARNLRRAIEEPARRCGLELEPGLTRRILTDVADRPGTLPLLEHLLLELWRRRRERTLTLEAYGASGGVEGALARRANEVYGAMDPERQAIARRVLLRLTQPGEGTEDTRRRATRAELVTDPAEQADVDAVVESLAEARLVTTGVDEATEAPIVEITHEALIRGWPALRGWLDEDRDRLRAERRLSDAAVEWDRGGRDESALYRGARLAAWSERDTAGLTPLEREFLVASTARAERDRHARRTRIRVAIGALSLALAVIAGVAVFAFLQRDDAADQRDIAESRQVAAGSRERLDADPEQALLLAQSALAIAPTAQAEEALRLSASASRVRFAFDGHDGPVRAVTATRDGELVASAGDDGTVQIWNPTDPQSDPLVLDAGSDVTALASADRDLVVSGARDGSVRQWNPVTGAPGPVLDAGSGNAVSVGVSEDGTVIAAAGEDGLVRVWSSGSAEPRVLEGEGVPLRGMAVSPDGRFVAAGGESPNTLLWNVRSGEVAQTLGGHTSFVSGVTFSPDSRRVLSASYDYTVRSWPVDGGAPTVMDSLGTALTSVAVSPDGTQVITAAIDGSAIVWPATGGRRIADLPGHRAPATAAAFVPGSTFVVSAGEDGLVRGYDLATVQPAFLPSTTFIEGRFTGTRDDIDLYSYDGAIDRWHPATGRSERLAEPGAQPLNGISANDAGDIARSLPGRTVQVTRADGRELAPITGFPEEAYQLSLSSDGGWVALTDTVGRILAWDLGARQPRRIVAGRGNETSIAAAGPGGAVAATLDGSVLLWARPGAAMRRFEASPLGVTSLAFTPDGTALATGSSDGTIRIWPLDGGESTALMRNPKGVQGMTFDDAGDLLVAAATDETRVWDWRRGIALDSWSDPGVLRARIDADGHQVMSIGQEGARLWTCDVCGSLDEARAIAAQRVTRSLTPDERREFGL